ncbi:MAG TPA: hypothetical protein VGR78_16045, partial [Verrucomicrobiae bacterium]|nr:hypothetical protein [Verrucomicrobiae bacterium]
FGVTNFFTPWDITGTDSGFVAVEGSGGRVGFSADARQWKVIKPSGTPELYRVTYGSGMWVAAGGNLNAVLATSPDGLSWTVQKRSATAIYRGVNFGNNLFVAVGDPVLTTVSSAPSLATQSIEGPPTLVLPPVPVKCQLLSSEDLQQWPTEANYTMGTVGGNVSLQEMGLHKSYKLRVGE